MSKGGPVGEDEERKILEALESGRSVRDVAAEFQRATGTISNVAARNGLDLERSATKKAALLNSCYASEARIRLIGRGLDRVDKLLRTCDSARDLQALAMASAIWIDKRRQEETTDPTGRGGEIRALFDKMSGEEARP
ncbi:MAG TPA: hypothetical protein PLX30_11045 [Methanothrix sp.]|nr:hypothetical protein [Methanothrix sp.]